MVSAGDGQPCLWKATVSGDDSKGEDSHFNSSGRQKNLNQTTVDLDVTVKVESMKWILKDCSMSSGLWERKLV